MAPIPSTRKGTLPPGLDFEGFDALEHQRVKLFRRYERGLMMPIELADKLRYVCYEAKDTTVKPKPSSRTKQESDPYEQLLAETEVFLASPFDPCRSFMITRCTQELAKIHEKLAAKFLHSLDSDPDNADRWTAWLTETPARVANDTPESFLANPPLDRLQVHEIVRINRIDLALAVFPVDTDGSHPAVDGAFREDTDHMSYAGRLVLRWLKLLVEAGNQQVIDHFVLLVQGCHVRVTWDILNELVAVSDDWVSHVTQTLERSDKIWGNSSRYRQESLVIAIESRLGSTLSEEIRLQVYGSFGYEGMEARSGDRFASIAAVKQALTELDQRGGAEEPSA